MTEKANPSINRPAEAFKTAGAIALAGGSEVGWVSASASPSEIAQQDPDISESSLDAFAENHSASSLDVTIEGGEAFVFGSWLAIDTNTTVTLATSTASQTVYVGWNKDGSDDVIVGLESDFATASGDTDEKIPLWDFDTDSTGVTSATDRRYIGRTQGATTFRGLVDLNANDLQDDTDTIWDASAEEIPDSAMGSIDNSTLTNSSVTVTAGDGVKGGGSVSLGGSITINIEPADFAGTHLSDDGNDNLTVDDDFLLNSGDTMTGDFTVQNALFADQSTGNLDIAGELTENASI